VGSKGVGPKIAAGASRREIGARRKVLRRSAGVRSNGVAIFVDSVAR
jgi:hypothetical protein